MQRRISRREMVKSMTGFTLGAGIVNFPFNRSITSAPFKQTGNQISVKVSPPGPKSLALLDDVKKYVGRSNYAGLYGIGLKGGNGVYIEDMDGNVYIDCLTSASSTLLGYSHDEVAKAYYDSATKMQQTCYVYSPT